MNKNWLFGTTALAVAASFGAIAPANAQAFKTNNTEVTIGGLSRGFVGAVSYDRLSGHTSSADVQTAVRFDVTARFATANGMQALGVFQLEDQTGFSYDTTNSRFNQDSLFRRAYAGIGGAFGQVRVGRDDNASQQGFVGSFDAFTAGSARLGKIYDFVGGGGPATVSADDTGYGSTSIRLYDRQSEKLIYISPRIEGFQLIASWTPEISAGRHASQVATTGQSYDNGKAVALNFTRPIGDVAVSAYGTYYHWNATNPGARATGTGTAAFKIPDAKAWGLGANAVWQGIQIGGSYTDYKDVANIMRGSHTAGDTVNIVGMGATASALGNTVTNQMVISDSRAYEAGVGYIFGPASVSLNYFNGKATPDRVNRETGVKNASTLGDDKRTALALNGAYTLAPGVSVQLSVFTLKQVGGYYASFSSVPNNIKTTQKANGAVSALVLAF
ncbi:MAG: porin [Telmatospirillum sp.]|nr:porin [Telmatospirillum sp.]